MTTAPAERTPKNNAYLAESCDLLGWSPSDLARALGVTPRTAQRWINSPRDHAAPAWAVSAIKGELLKRGLL